MSIIGDPECDNARRCLADDKDAEIKQLRAAVEAGLPYLVYLSDDEDLDATMEACLQPQVNEVRDKMCAALSNN